MEGVPIQKGRAPTYYLAKICRKLHETEENWTEGARPKFYYVDPPLLTDPSLNSLFTKTTTICKTIEAIRK